MKKHKIHTNNCYNLQYKNMNTTANSAADASSRNGIRIYLILLCHFITQNQM